MNIYDPRNRLIEMIDPGGGSTKFGYDLDDNLKSVTAHPEGRAHKRVQRIPKHERSSECGEESRGEHPVDNETTFVYDFRNRLIGETDPLGNTISMSMMGWIT